MSRVIKINFTDFYHLPNKEENYLYKYLKQYFNLELSDDPDVVIYSNYGFEHKQYKCLRVLFCAEYAIPNIEDCDYCFSQHHASYWGKNYRLPMYVFWQNFSLKFEELLRPVDYEEIRKQDRGFCSFVVSSPLGSKARVDFMHELSSYKKVDSGGKLLNNIGGTVANKRDFLKKYKFNIAFANGLADGYADEKIVDPMFVDSIPVFWGNPRIAEDFNPASFVNCHDYDNFDSVIKEVIRIDQNEDVYRSYLEQPWFRENKLSKYVDLIRLQKRFRYIFSQIGKKVPAARSKRRFFYKLLKKLKPLTPIVQQWGDYQPSN